MRDFLAGRFSTVIRTLACLGTVALTACAAAPSEGESESGAALSQSGQSSPEQASNTVLHLKGTFVGGAESTFDFEFVECPAPAGEAATKGWFTSTPRPGASDARATPDDMILGTVDLHLRCPCSGFGGIDETSSYGYSLSYERTATGISSPQLTQFWHGLENGADPITMTGPDALRVTHSPASADVIAACARPTLPATP